MTDTVHLAPGGTPKSPTLDDNAAVNSPMMHSNEPMMHTAPGTSEATATAPHLDSGHADSGTAHAHAHHTTWKDRVKHVVDVIKHPDARNRRGSKPETHVFGSSEGSHADKTDPM